MRNSQSLLDAIFDGAAAKSVADAVNEARRMQGVRTRRRFAIITLALVALVVVVTKPGFYPSSESMPPQVAAASGLRIFSTADTDFPLLRFTSMGAGRSLALFSNRDQPLIIRDINDHTLFELLNPYGPIIVYVGIERRPTLLLLSPSR